MATSRRKGTNEVISTYGGSKDYTSLSSWESDSQIDLTGVGDNIHEVSISNVSATRFDLTETLSFSSSGATAVCVGTNLARTKMWYRSVSGTPTTADTITGDTTTATADIDSIDSTNTAVSHVLEGYDTQASFNDRVEIKGATTDATHFRVIRPAGTIGQGDWEGHDGTSNTGLYFNTTTHDHSFSITESFSSIQDLIITHDVDGVTTRYTLRCSGGHTNPLFVGNICFDCVNATANTKHQISTSTDSWWINCIMENCDDHGWEMKQGNGNDCYIYNCKSVNNGDRGFSNAGGTGISVLKNCIGDSNVNDDFEAGVYTGSDYNSASDTTNPDSGANNRTEQSFSYVDETGNDYHLASDDGGAKGFGLDLSSDSEFAFDDDIDGTVRGATWDIGFDQFVAFGLDFQFFNRKQNTLLRM